MLCGHLEFGILEEEITSTLEGGLSGLLKSLKSIVQVRHWLYQVGQ